MSAPPAEKTALEWEFRRELIRMLAVRSTPSAVPPGHVDPDYVKYVLVSGLKGHGLRAKGTSILETSLERHRPRARLLKPSPQGTGQGHVNLVVFGRALGPWKNVFLFRN
jgi:hypothetical protein